MKKLLTFLMLAMLSTLTFGQHDTFDKITKDGGSGDDKIYDICLDASGNKYIAGTFKNTVDFGNGVSITAIDNADAFIAKYDASGNILWANGFGGNLTDYSDVIKIDKDGNVITASRFYQTVIFGTDTLFSDGSWDIAIVKFDSDGNYIWAKKAGTKNMDEASDLKVDSQGNYILLGYYDVNTDLTLPLVYESLKIYSHGERDAFVIKMDSDGNPIWGVTGGGTDNDYSGGLVIDENDNIYFDGYYDNVEAAFGTTILPNTGNNELFTAKLNSAGEYQWAASATGPGEDYGYDIDYIPGSDTEPGIVLVTGAFQDLLYAGTSNELFESAGGADIYVLTYDIDGNYNDGYSFGGASDDQAEAISYIPNSDRDYYISGTTKSNLPVLMNDSLFNYGSRDMLVMRMHQDSLIWVKNYGGNSDEYIYSSTIDKNGVVYFGGTYKSSPALFDPYIETSVGGYELWLGQMKAHTVVYLECNLAVQIANGTFDPNEDEVFVRGDFQTDAKDPNGNWQGNMFQLLDNDQNQIYTTIINLPTDSLKTYNFLFAIGDELESVENRNFAVNASDVWVNQIFFNSDAIPSVPIIYSISDIPNDQGGKVRISFTTSTTNTSYSVWRKMDNNGWDAIGSFNAIQDSNYHFVSPTLGDSTVNGIVWSTFRISAHTSDPKVFYMSAADSGYSIDNLAPVVPAGVLAKGFDEKVELAWDKNVENDFQYYAIYRSTDPNFIADTMKVATYTTTENSFNDDNVIQGVTYYYLVTAVDYAGNNSEVSQKVFALVTDVETGLEIPTVYELGQNYPNPFNPSTVIKFSIPNSGLVTLKVFNILGQEVVTLVNEIKPIGIFEVSFDASLLTTGMYIYRIESGSFTATKKMMLIK